MHCVLILLSVFRREVKRNLVRIQGYPSAGKQERTPHLKRRYFRREAVVSPKTCRWPASESGTGGGHQLGVSRRERAHRLCVGIDLDGAAGTAGTFRREFRSIGDGDSP